MEPDTHFTDRKDRLVHLRRVGADDIEAVYALELAMTADGHGMVIDTDELGTLEEFRGRRSSLYASPTGALQVGAWSGERLVGTAELTRISIRRCHHVGSLSMGTHPEWRGAGLGRALLDSVLTWADAVGVLRTELFVRADNPAAISLYQSSGFELCCTRPAFVHDPDGTWVDDHYMARVRPR